MPRNRWFRYHHLFQQILRDRLGRHRSQKEIGGLHARASAWFAANELIDEALRHAMAAGDVDGAVQLVADHRQAVHNSDRWYIFEKWLALFPDKIVGQHPQLLMIRAWVFYHHFDIPAIPAVVDTVEALLTDAAGDQPLRGEVAFFRGYIDYFMNKGVKQPQAPR